MKFVKSVSSESETQKFAESIGRSLRGSECFEFVSDLGGGKTTFIKGLVKGAGSDEIVNSPTFTVGKQYQIPNGRIYHYDFYRLPEPGLVREELSEALEDENNIIVVEWAESVRETLPSKRVVVHIDKVADNPDGRMIDISFDKELDYLFEGTEE